MVFFRLLLFLFPLFTFGQEPAGQEQKPTASSEPPFQSGVTAYQAKDYEKARQEFERATQTQEHNPALLTNLGLSYYQLNKKGMAIAQFRRALSLDPKFMAAESALNYSLSQLEVKEIPRRIETYETFRSVLLQPVSINLYLGLGALCFLIGGLRLIPYFSQKRRAEQEEVPPPPAPILGAGASLLFLVFLTLGCFKAYDMTIPRATIVGDKVSVLAAPEEGQMSLYEINMGLEVLVQKISGDWVQVTYPGGLTGWVKKDQILVTTLGGF